MQVNRDTLRGMDLRGIIRKLIGDVTKTPQQATDKETRGGKTTDLKLYIISRKSPILGNIETVLEDARQNPNISKAGKDFLNNHIFSESVLGDDISWLEIRSSRYERSDEIVLADRGEYIWALSTDRKEFLDDTWGKFLKYVPHVDRVYLPPDELEEIIKSVRTSDVSGFTAKYFSHYRDRSATLRFHGAEPSDLAKAESEFNARPTRIEFDQRNSPTAAIQGSGSSEGLLKIESVRLNSEEKATDTLYNTTEKFISKDSDIFEISTDSKIEFLRDGFTVTEFTSIELHSPEREEVGQLGKEIEDTILAKDRYRWGQWDSTTFFVYDKDHEEIFELGIESNELVLHTRESTSELSLRAFCRIVLSEFDSTYSIRKKETRGAA